MPIWYLFNSSLSKWYWIDRWIDLCSIYYNIIYGLSKRCMSRVRPLTVKKSTTVKIAPIRHIEFVTARAHYVFCVRAHLPKSFNSGILPLHSKFVALFLTLSKLYVLGNHVSNYWVIPKLCAIAYILSK